MIPEFEIVLLASVVALACALPGALLLLRKQSLMSDAISHAILLGIVVSFFIVKDLTSPFLIVGAAAMGVLTVVVIEAITATRKIKEDASIGLVFPFFFSLGVILITRFASSIHLDTDAVLLGEIALAPFNRLDVMGVDLGPKALWVMGIILLLSLAFIVIFFKEIKIVLFDPGLAATLGFAPVAIQYAIMTLISVTAVGAFDAVGSVLVVAFMVTPPATAYLLTKRLSVLLLLSAIAGVLAAILGYLLARVTDASIAGAMAMMSGLLFLLALLFAPERGLVAQARSHRRKRVLFAAKLLVVHILDHEGTPHAARENTIQHTREHLRWDETFSKKAIGLARQSGWIAQEGYLLVLTPAGRGAARDAMTMT